MDVDYFTPDRDRRDAGADLHRRHEHVREPRCGHVLPQRDLAADHGAERRTSASSPSGRIRRRSCWRWPRATRGSSSPATSTTSGRYVRQAAVYVVPLRVGGGTRLKVLDAMAMGKAIVSTSIGCEGIDVHAGRAPRRRRHAARPSPTPTWRCWPIRTGAGSARRGPRARSSSARYCVARRRRQPDRRVSRCASIGGGRSSMNRYALGALPRGAGLGPEPDADRLQRAARARALRRPLSGVPRPARARPSGSRARSWRPYQDERLRAIVAHAYETVPFYRRRFDECALTPPDIRGRADLPKLPLLTRDDIRTHFDDLRSRDAAAPRRCERATRAARPARRSRSATTTTRSG